MKMKNVMTAMLSVFFAFAMLAATAQGSDFPSKSITAICPWSAGGGTDTILRGLAKETETFQSEEFVKN